MEIPFISKDAVRSRFVEIGEMFDAFRGDVQAKSPGVEVQIDQRKLKLAVESYFVDVARYKWWHFEDPETALLDSTKKAAYTAYWLNKICPVFVIPDGHKAGGREQADLTRELPVVANIHFTCFVIFVFLDFVLADELLEKLLYHMLWREESPKSYMLLFEMLDAAFRGEALFPKSS